MKRKEQVTIGSELKQILDHKGITAYWIAKELGLAQSYLSRLFKDKLNPSYGLVKKIAGILGYDLCLVKSQKEGGEKPKPKTRKRRKI
jgi:transcriptional regulator with XRE-family HTH domain